MVKAWDDDGYYVLSLLIQEAELNFYQQHLLEEIIHHYEQLYKYKFKKRHKPLLFRWERASGHA
ncbi:hypothetical protein [Bacillus sp. DX1.1]|uniref:hypothetical protein n=1 Tax=Bacillus sp. DX1.1 TaxID=3055866 RepID=UPI0025A1CE74|nr:hypothetical protein [Bacillus sp. DX1.1]